jgi:hypothetical protein
MRHDLFVNPSRRGRSEFPFVAAVPSKVVDGKRQVVAPVVPVTASTPASRLLPVAENGGRRFAVVCALLTNIPARDLRDPAVSIAAYCDDLTRALDWIFFGI